MENVFNIGDQVVVKGKSIGIPLIFLSFQDCTGYLVGRQGVVQHVAREAVYVELGNDMLAFAPDDLTHFVDWKHPYEPCS